jgi:hypothetical protein
VDSNPFDVSREPKYVAEGEEFGDSIGRNTRPKWSIASTPFQKRLLSAVGKTYYKTHNERSAVVAIEKSAISLTGGLISVYPLEWVDQCIDWANKKRRVDGQWVGFIGLVNLINNEDKKIEFVQRWQKENSDIPLRKSTSQEQANRDEVEEPKYDPRG